METLGEAYWEEGIPRGTYCYTYLGTADHGGYKFKSCPHYKLAQRSRKEKS